MPDRHPFARSLSDAPHRSSCRSGARSPPRSTVSAPMGSTVLGLDSTRREPLALKSRCNAGAFSLGRHRAMGHIFSPAADTWMRLFMAGAASLVAGSVLFAIGFGHSDWVTGANTHPPAQLVPFSHRHHNGELGIDCRYCHTSVADGPHAGLPPTHTCMTCHSQIWT